MKKLYLFLFLMTLFVPGVRADVKAVMTTALPTGADFTFTVNAGTFTVDWGDGNALALQSTGVPVTGKLVGQSVTVTGAVLTELSCPGQQVTSLTLPSTLQRLDCSDNALSGSFSLSGVRSSIRFLDCSGNEITTLSSITQCTRLEELIASDNQIGTLTLTTMTALRTLWADGNQLKTFSIPKNIESLVLDRNQLTKLSDNSQGNQQLYDLWAADNQLQTMSLRNSPLLETMNLSDNQIESLSFGASSWKAKLIILSGNKLDFRTMPLATERLVAGEQMEIPVEATVYEVGEDVTFPDMRTNSAGTSLSVTYTFYLSDGTKLVRGSLTSDKDYAYAASSTPYIFRFLKEQELPIHLELTSTKSPLKGNVLYSVPFRVVRDKTGIAGAEASHLRVGKQGRMLTLQADKLTPVTVVDVEGRLRWSGDVLGQQRIQLERGIYLINGRKIAF